MFKFGIIGAGNIAHRFCDAVRLIEGVEVTGVSSKNIDKAKEFAIKENIGFFGSYEKMLTDCETDAVYIATTHNFHYGNAILCLNHGKPVIIEKPMVCNKKDAEEIFNLAKEKNLFVMEAMWARFLPHIRKVREWIADGAIGTPALASFSIGFKVDPNPENRYLNPELAGGALYDMGVYAIEVMTYLVNQPVRETRSIVIPAVTGVDMTDNISIKFETCIGNIQLTFAANAPSMSYIYGDGGYIQIPHFIGGNDCFLYRDGNPVEHFTEDYQNGFTYEIEETVRCVKAGLLESPVVPRADTIMCAGIFDEVLKFTFLQ